MALEVYDGYQWVEDDTYQWVDSDDDQWVLDEALDIWSRIEEMPDNTSDIFFRMLDYLPPSFNADPQKVQAFSITHPTLQVKFTIDGFYFQLWLGNVFIPTFTADMRQLNASGQSFTIQNLIDALNALSLGLVLTSLYTGLSTADAQNFYSKPAVRFLPTKNDQSGMVYIFTSTTWAILSACAIELMDLQTTLKESIRQLTIVGANSFIQDYWGTFSGTQRLAADADNDPHYGQCILVDFKTPKSNNRALEAIIKTVVGLTVTVVDLGQLPSSMGIMYMNDYETPLYDTAFCLWNYDGGRPLYFPATFGVVLDSNTTIESLTADQLTLLTSVLLSYKAAGTSPALVWQGTAAQFLMNDTLTPINEPGFPLQAWYQSYGAYSIAFLQENGAWGTPVQ